MGAVCLFIFSKAFIIPSLHLLKRNFEFVCINRKRYIFNHLKKSLNLINPAIHEYGGFLNRRLNMNEKIYSVMRLYHGSRISFIRVYIV